MALQPFLRLADKGDGVEVGGPPVTKWISQMAATKGNPQRILKRKAKLLFFLQIQNIYGKYSGLLAKEILKGI